MTYMLNDIHRRPDPGLPSARGTYRVASGLTQAAYLHLAHRETEPLNESAGTLTENRRRESLTNLSFENKVALVTALGLP